MAKKTKAKTSAKRSSGPSEVISDLAVRIGRLETSQTAKKTTSDPSRDRIDPRKKLLARVAGNVAGTLVSAPSPSISSAEAIATVAVDIAEQILRKAGIPVPSASASSASSAATEDSSEAAS